MNNRRETALLDLASMKANFISLHSLSKDWEFKHVVFAEQMRETIKVTTRDLILYLTHRGGRQRLYRIYQGFNKIAHVSDIFRSFSDHIHFCVLVGRCYW